MSRGVIFLSMILLVLHQGMTGEKSLLLTTTSTSIEIK
jgi:hypothetical protein